MSQDFHSSRSRSGSLITQGKAYFGIFVSSSSRAVSRHPAGSSFERVSVERVPPPGSLFRTDFHGLPGGAPSGRGFDRRSAARSPSPFHICAARSSRTKEELSSAGGSGGGSG